MFVIFFARQLSRLLDKETMAGPICYWGTCDCYYCDTPSVTKNSKTRLTLRHLYEHKRHREHELGSRNNQFTYLLLTDGQALAVYIQWIMTMHVGSIVDTLVGPWLHDRSIYSYPDIYGYTVVGNPLMPIHSPRRFHHRFRTIRRAFRWSDSLVSRAKPQRSSYRFHPSDN